MGLHESSYSSQTGPTHISSAQLDEARSVTLHTSGSAHFAYLEQDDRGRVYLYLRGLRFDTHDFVPISLIECLFISPGSTASQFVCKQMLMHHGYRETGWPTLARRFLSQHTTDLPPG